MYIKYLKFSLFESKNSFEDIKSDIEECFVDISDIFDIEVTKTGNTQKMKITSHKDLRYEDSKNFPTNFSIAIDKLTLLYPNLHFNKGFWRRSKLIVKLDCINSHNKKLGYTYPN